MAREIILKLLIECAKEAGLDVGKIETIRMIGKWMNEIEAMKLSQSDESCRENEIGIDQTV